MLLCAPTIVEKLKTPQLVKTCHLIQLLSAFQAAPDDYHLPINFTEDPLSKCMQPSTPV